MLEVGVDGHVIVVHNSLGRIFRCCCGRLKWGRNCRNHDFGLKGAQSNIGRELFETESILQYFMGYVGMYDWALQRCGGAVHVLLVR